MIKNISIRAKFSILVFTLVSAAVIASSIISYNASRDALQERYQENLALLARNKALEVELLLEGIHENLAMAASDKIFTPVETASPAAEENEAEATFASFTQDEAPLFDDQGMDMGFMDDTPVESNEPDYNNYLSELKSALPIAHAYLTEDNGVVINSTNGASVNQNFPDPGSIISRSAEGLYTSDIYSNKFFVGAPVNNGMRSSLLIFEVDASRLNDIMLDTLGLGQTGELLLISANNSASEVSILNKLRHKPADSVEIMHVSGTQGQAFVRGLEGETGEAFDTDYRKEKVLAAFHPVKNASWAVIAKMDTTEIYGESGNLLFKYLSAGALLLISSLFLSFIVSRQLTDPLNSLKGNLDLLRKGILPDSIPRTTRDEIGDMADNLDQLNSSLKNTAQFAQEIGQGNFAADYEPVSDSDALGNALIDMRDNLIVAEKKDKERNWIVTGVAEIGEILRASDNIQELGDEVIKYILDKIDAVQGAMYVVNEENGEQILEMTSSYAYSRKKYLEAKFKFAEGLVGQAAAEMDTVLRTEVPENYVSMTSGILGETKPSCILIVPLVAEEQVYGALEFAGYRKFNESEVRFVEELSVITARTVFNIKVNERTRRLLAESQAMSGELQEKQEILRQNAEEMQATQEELQRSNHRLEEQIEEVNRTQHRMQLLLENASEVITIYDEEGTVTYVSPSVEPILGYSQSEIQGEADVEKVHPEGQKAFKKMFKILLEKPDEQVSIQYQYRTKEGEYIWLEATGSNFLANPAINGLVVNSQNITERRRAEQEQRMRSKMQALSENSPDLITRLEQGEISYINPIIEEYTGKTPTNYLNKPIEETELNPIVLERWLSIVEEVRENDEMLKTEMDFISELGDRIMQVNAIPEYDENETLESVLVVSHDITERKRIELEIQNKNKKIADSINYSKRIQNAILPNNAVINRYLPDSFILYKPKDVVSGDFPWFVEMKDAIYIAAVDCTGHGVPGALLSLIGYFLLNDIVKSRKISDPGEILDILDEGVTTTLRQDQDDSRTKDGMDIALCRIDKKTNEVQFAGAHRPLYAVKDGELQEIKGNKFAIGGGIYKNQTKFTNHTVEMKKGDSIFFCSDGFPDQFGGPDNRKFGPRRLREMISEFSASPMKDAYEIFDDAWEAWKGKEKQTDDVLLIGIKF